MKKFIVIILVCLCLLSNAQSETTHGIKWINDLSWSHIKEKARKENKYIFVDCFTTWCGPCKLMDKNVYTNDSVGDFFNEKFCSVKVQMDKTDKDDDQITKWYGDADAISREYRVQGYPTFIFLSPQGKLVDVAIGYQPIPTFLALAKNAIQPGKEYNNPYAQYERLVMLYNNGVKRYDSMPYMIKTAYQIDEQDFGKQLLNEYTDYVMTLDAEGQFSKDNIELWASFLLKSDTKRFKFFCDNAQRINQVMGKSYYAEIVIDRTIQNEIILPFLEKQNTNPTVAMSGMMITGPDLKADYSEANWKSLKKVIRKKYGRSISNRNLLAAKVLWYKRHRNIPATTKYALLQLEKYPKDTIDILEDAGAINDLAWEAFLHFNDKKLLNRVLPWIAIPAVRFEKGVMFWDTYANLLYKVGRKDEAIWWEEKAAKFDPGRGYDKIVSQMKRGEQTYVQQGALWE